MNSKILSLTLLKNIMENKKLPTILVLTSVDPHNGPAVVAENFYRAFLNQGFSVDLCVHILWMDTLNIYIYIMGKEVS